MNELTKPETVTFLERVVRDPTIDVAKVEQIIALQERIADREAKREFAQAMNRLQAEMPQIAKDETNPHARSRYASYEAIDAILRPLYTRHGFSVRFTTSSNGNRIRVGCVVSHGSHSELAAELESGPDTSGSQGRQNKTEVQGIGSIVSYLRRYTLMAAFAVALQDDETDDDGHRQPVRQPAPDGNGVHVQRPPDPPRLTIGEWLEQMEAKMRAAGTREELDALLGTDEVQKLLAVASEAVKTRLDELVQANLDRFTGPGAES